MVSWCIQDHCSNTVLLHCLHANHLFTFTALLSVAHKERILKEVSIMLSFNHTNVMSLIGMCIDREMPLLLMPFMSNGNVLKYVRSNREKLYFIEKRDNYEVGYNPCILGFHKMKGSYRYIHVLFNT